MPTAKIKNAVYSSKQATLIILLPNIAKIIKVEFDNLSG